MYILFADTAFLVTIVDADEVAYVVSESSCLRVSHLSLAFFSRQRLNFPCVYKRERFLEKK